MIDDACAFRVMFGDIEDSNKQFFKETHFSSFKASIEGENMPGSSDWVSLEPNIFQGDDVVDIYFDGRPFREPTQPRAEVNFLFNLKVNEVSRLVIFAKLSNLLSNSYIAKTVPSFSSLYYFLEWGISAKIDSMKFRCLAVIPLEETMSVLVLLIHSGSSWE